MGLKKISEFLALRRNTSRLLVALLLADTGEKLWLVSRRVAVERESVGEFHWRGHLRRAGDGLVLVVYLPEEKIIEDKKSISQG